MPGRGMIGVKQVCVCYFRAVFFLHGVMCTILVVVVVVVVFVVVVVVAVGIVVLVCVAEIDSMSSSSWFCCCCCCCCCCCFCCCCGVWLLFPRCGLLLLLFPQCGGGRVWFVRRATEAGSCDASERSLLRLFIDTARASVCVFASINETGFVSPAVGRDASGARHSCRRRVVVGIIVILRANREQRALLPG